MEKSINNLIAGETYEVGSGTILRPAERHALEVYFMKTDLIYCIASFTNSGSGLSYKICHVPTRLVFTLEEYYIKKLLLTHVI